MAAKQTKGLGKGLSALISTNMENVSGDRLEQIKITEIVANESQPRKDFDEEKLQGLIDSIDENGIIQPLIVHELRPGKYEIIAGERRWRAATRIGLQTVPAIVRNVDEIKKMQQALIENIVREDLNAIEEAEAIQSLIEGHGLLQEDVAKVLGRSRSAVTNTLRLLQLESELRAYVIDGKLTAGHARALLALEDKALQKTLANQIVEGGLSVRASEELVTRYLNRKPAKEKKPVLSNKEITVSDLENRLKRHFGTKVQVQDRRGKGKVVISYSSLDELDRLLEQWGLESDR